MEPGIAATSGSASVSWCQYSKTSESGQSKKRTHSLERANLQVPIENPIHYIANLREATTSKLLTADTDLGPERF